MEQAAVGEQLDAVFARHAGERGELIPILQDIQALLGYLPPEALSAAARFLNVPEVVVYEVATFYSQFHLSRQGRHKVRVCQGTACHVRGGLRVLEAVEERLGIRSGHTTEDYRFSLDRVACFGSCALAPVMVIDGEVHGAVTPHKAMELLERLQ